MIIAIVIAVVSTGARGSDPGPAFAPGRNNVVGKLPDRGQPPGIILLGKVSSALECERAALKNARATSWTWYHCDISVGPTTNYSCHCFARTDAVWQPVPQLHVDSGHLGRILRPRQPTAIVAPAVPRCASELDCGLNGMCNYTSGVCRCDAPWIGPACSVLDLLPVQPDTGYHTFDTSGKPTSSWGGSVVGDDHGGYFMFSSEMLGHCGIASWTFNSHIVLAHSRSAVGPYTFLREILPAFAHEPTAGRGPNGEYVIWYTRYEHLNESSPCLDVCVDGSTEKGRCTEPPAQSHMQSWMTWARDPLGAWSEPVLVYNGFAADMEGTLVYTGDTNLAPVIYANGSLVGLWRAHWTSDPQGRSSGIFVVRATNWKQPSTYDFGNVTVAASIMHPVMQPGQGNFLDEEDPHVWLDHKGRLHAVVHMFAMGGHLASDDGGHNWRWFGPVTYNATHDPPAENWRKSVWSEHAVIAAGPGSKSVIPGPLEIGIQRRERPHIVFNATGDIVAVSHGVTLSTGALDYCWTLFQPTSCGRHEN